MLYIIQIDPMEGTSYHPVQSQSHREECWLEGYLALPEQLVEKAVSCGGNCELVIEDGALVDLVPIPVEAVPEEPSPEGDTEAMLVDHELRLTLLELGVSL